MDQNLKLALKAVRKAGVYLLEVQEKGEIIEVFLKHRGEDRQEPVTRFDIESQRIIQETLASSGLPFWGEEEERTGEPNGWIVDPVDGTGSFAAGNPEWGVSIGLAENGVAKLGVMAFPRDNGILYADRRLGARKVWFDHTSDSQEVRVRHPMDREKGKWKLLIDIPFSKLNEERAYEMRRRLSGLGECISSKSATHHIAELLLGDLDAFYQDCQGIKNNIFDIAAACVIAQEAGAIVTLADGNPFSLTRGTILVARDKEVFDAIMKRIRDLE